MKQERAITFDVDEATFRKWVGLRSLTNKKGYILGKEGIELLVEKYGDPLENTNEVDFDMSDLRKYIKKTIQESLEELLK